MCPAAAYFLARTVPAAPNHDGVEDAADYTVWRDAQFNQRLKVRWQRPWKH
jgi:hypothetical protein